MNLEKLSRYALISVGALAAGLILAIVAKFALPALSPFIIAWLAAMATNGAASSLSHKIRVPARVIRLMMSIFLVLAAFLLVSLLLWQTTASLGRLLSDLGEGNLFYDFLSVLTTKHGLIGQGLSEELAAGIEGTVDKMISSAMSRLGETATNAVGAVPRAFFYLIVTLISLFYFSLDLEKINDAVRKILPEKLCKSLVSFRNGVFFVLKKYLRSYFILMMITFLIMLISFLILGVNHAALIALVVAFLDILPVIGVGTLLIPWAIIELSVGSRFLGIGLLILFVVNTLIRQFIEPKIVGKNLNIHPIATLVMIYVGYSLFGIVGIILLPVIAVSISAVLRKDSSAEIA
jgi:sporulation integral membrane protein YtvI